MQDEPMSDELWADFQYAVENTVWEVYEATIYFRGTGTGWSADWGDEDAYTLIVSDPTYGVTWEELKHALARLARAFNQNAIALTGRYSNGETLFV